MPAQRQSSIKLVRYAEKCMSWTHRQNPVTLEYHSLRVRFCTCMLHAVQYDSSPPGSSACFFSTQSCREFNNLPLISQNERISAVRVRESIAETLQKPGYMLWEGECWWMQGQPRCMLGAWLCKESCSAEARRPRRPAF